MANKRLNEAQSLFVMQRIADVAKNASEMAELCGCSVRTAFYHIGKFQQSQPFRMRRVFAVRAAEKLGISTADLVDGRSPDLECIYGHPPSHLSETERRKHAADICVNLSNALFNRDRPTADYRVICGANRLPAMLVVETLKKNPPGTADTPVAIRVDFEDSKTYVSLVVVSSKRFIYTGELNTFNVAKVLRAITDHKISIATA